MHGCEAGLRSRPPALGGCRAHRPRCCSGPQRASRLDRGGCRGPGRQRRGRDRRDGGRHDAERRAERRSASAGHRGPRRTSADDADEPAGTETSKPKAAKGRPSRSTARAQRPPRSFDPAACAAALHHGDYVAQVAAATEGKADRGALVSAAARSDCGKPTRRDRSRRRRRARRRRARDIGGAPGRTARKISRAPGRTAREISRAPGRTARESAEHAAK